MSEAPHPRLPFEVLQQLDLPLSEVVSGRIAFAHDLFLTFPYEICEQLPDDGRDLVVLIGKSERRQAIAELSHYPGRVILVMAAGDAPVRQAYFPGRSLPPNFVALFATNNKLADRRAVSIPLGVRINKLQHLRFVRQNRPERTKLLYGNFTVNRVHYRGGKNGERSTRAMLAERLEKKPWVDLDLSVLRRDAPDDLVRYYSQLAAHRFVLSPEGNGIDCYRTWEALYLGAIPIVMSSPAMSAFAALPILFTDDYSELSEDYLQLRWEEMSNRSYDISQMLASHYRRLFLAAVGRLESPRFVCWRFDSPKFKDVLRLSSRAAAKTSGETPVGPFVAVPSLMAPEGWNAPGRLRVSTGKTPSEMRIGVEGAGRPVAEIPLHTIVGAPLRLTAVVRSEAGVDAVLVVEAEDRPDVIASVEIEPGSGELRLDFVARADRTVLTLRAPNASEGAAWVLSDFRLRAEL